MDWASGLMPNMPDVWGEGALFAFSGMDGETCTRTGFTATLGAVPYGLLIHTPHRRILDLHLPAQGTSQLVTGDVVSVTTPEGDLTMAFCSWDAIVGSLPACAELALRLEGEALVPAAQGCRVTWDEGHHDAVVLVIREGGRFVVAYGTSVDQAQSRAESALALDLAEVVAQRLATYSRLPRLADPSRDRLLRKCWSVMRVNTLAPEGPFRNRWSTPDRVPHRHMWLWDSVFHTYGMNHIDPELSWDFLCTALDQQREDGMIPHCMQVDGTVSSITQPPVLAQGVWANYEHLHDKERLAWALPRLLRYLDWNARNRDANRNGLLEWYIEENANCRSGESGMDNNQRFDSAILLDAVDFSTFQALDLRATSRIARELGDATTAEWCGVRALHLSRQIQLLLWDEAGGIYGDRDMQGQLTGVKAVSGFLPLLLDETPLARKKRLVQTLQDPQTFATAFPVPSISIDNPTWSTDLWRGATWINMNVLVIRGLRKAGYTELASALRSATLTYVARYYAQFGVIFEFYDARDQLPPVACDRKGRRREPYDIRAKMDSIRDYHWSAALVADLLLEEI